MHILTSFSEREYLLKILSPRRKKCLFHFLVSGSPIIPRLNRFSFHTLSHAFDSYIIFHFQLTCCRYSWRSQSGCIHCFVPTNNMSDFTSLYPLRLRVNVESALQKLINDFHTPSYRTEARNIARKQNWLLNSVCIFLYCCAFLM
jgi:hypothetical protein